MKHFLLYLSLLNSISISAQKRGKNVYNESVSMNSLQENSSSQDTKKNVLFISIDDLRPELNCYGSSNIITPNIDKLANEGMLFTNAYSQQAICTPSRISMLSGLRPSTTGIYDLTDKLKVEAPSVVSMPRNIKDAGYNTISLGKVYHHQDDDPNAWTEAAWRPGSNDGTWFYQGHLNSSPVDYGLDGKTLFGPPTENEDVADNWYQDGVTADKAIEKLEEYKDMPFFLAVGFKKPHLPFTAPEKYWNLYNRDNITPYTINTPEGLGNFSTTEWQELRSYFGIPKTGDILEEQAKELIHGYWACVSYIDAQIGKVINKLDELGLRDNTIIILWSDHGFKLGEYGDWCKHTNFEIDVRTPLIIDVPGMPGGIKCSHIVESVDVFPTVADLLGIIPPNGLDGMSLKPLLESPENPWKSAAFSQYPRWSNSRMGTTVRIENYRYTEYVLVETGEVVSSELYRHENNTALEIETENLIPLIDSHKEYGRERDFMKNLIDLGWDQVREGTTIQILGTTNSSVKLKINNVSNAYGFKLMMKQNNGSYSEILPGSIDKYTTEITIPDLIPSNSYIFKLKLLGDDYKGGYSNEVSITLKDQTELVENGSFSSGKDFSWRYNNNNISVVDYSLVSLENSSDVLKADITSLGTNFWDVGLINLKQNSLDSNLINISFYAKTSNDSSQVTFGFQSTTTPSITKYITTYIDTNWHKYEFDLLIESEFRNDWQFKFFLRDVATFHLDSLSAVTGFIEPVGQEAWEIEADKRIDTLRKGNFTLHILGADGLPMENIHTEIKMLQHDFPFESMLKLPGENDSEDLWTKAIALKYFNGGVISNEFKWSGMQPDEGPVNYSLVNNYLDWAEQFDFPMKGHVLIWGGTGENDGSDYHKLPKWVRESSNGIPGTEAEIEALVETRVKETVNYYKDRISVYDVLNEPTTNHADWLQKTVGNDINWKVFNWARESGPDAELLINDYGILNSVNTEPGSQIYDYVQIIHDIQANAPGTITGIGCQSHFNSSVPDEFYNNISYLNQQTGLPISITEFDLKVDQYTLSPTEQAKEYRKALKLAFSHPAVNSFVFWGFYDANHWKEGAGMFDENKIPKLAAYEVYKLIHEDWNTTAEKQTDAMGNIDVEAFYGSHEIIAEVNGELKRVLVDLTKESIEDTIIVNFTTSEPIKPVIDSVYQIDGNKLKITYNKPMDETTLHRSNFVINNILGAYTTGITLNPDKTSAILETNSSIDKTEYTTFSYIGNTALSVDGGQLVLFGPEEITADDSVLFLYLNFNEFGIPVLSWNHVQNTDSIKLILLDEKGEFVNDTSVNINPGSTSIVLTNFIIGNEYSYKLNIYTQGVLIESNTVSFNYDNKMLDNNGFEYGYQNWTKVFNSRFTEAEFSLTSDASDGELASQIQVSNGNLLHNVSLQTSSYSMLQAGETYKLSFYAKALGSENKVGLKLVSPDGEISLDNNIQLSNEYTKYAYFFETSFPSKYGIKLILGESESNYYFDDFKLEVANDTVISAINEKPIDKKTTDAIIVYYSQGSVTVEMLEDEFINDLVVYSYTGQVVGSFDNLNSKNHQINISGLNSGVYIILVNNKYSKKFFAIK